tara:strand:- start:430 stop:1434 length:1005 start_codon:yes stop_codon:yes gene_type:complete
MHSMLDYIDHLEADRFSPLGDFPVILTDAGRWERTAAPIQAIVIGHDLSGNLPVVDPALFDLLVTSAIDAPAPWVSISGDKIDAQLEALAAAVKAYPIPATILCQTLRLSEALPFAMALEAESMAYSTLLGGADFAQWRNDHPCPPASTTREELVRITRERNHVTLTLDHPADNNSMSAGMRDAFFGALANILDDPTRPSLTLRAAGKSFSTGGALWEFGSAGDLAQAHIVRTMHSCTRALYALGKRVEVVFHGGCVGSGIEIPAAAHRRIALPSAWFQLPELRMGLIPGAGGTVSIGRAIGRHRTTWMVLTGKRINATRAHQWGLVHTIKDVA